MWWWTFQVILITLAHASGARTCGEVTFAGLVDEVAAGTIGCDAGCDALTCTSSNVVVGIEVDGTSELGGTVPASIQSLSTLQTLVLSGARFTGTLPASLGSLSSLVHLQLSGSNITGPLPRALGSLGSLTRLQLDGNALTGPLPRALCSVDGLRVLNMNSNQLGHRTVEVRTSVIDTVWTNVSAGWNASDPAVRVEENRTVITYVDRPYSLPQCLGSLSGMQTLQLDDNGFGGVIPASLTSLTLFEALSIRSNGLSGTLPSQLLRISPLQQVMLDDNALTGVLPSTASTSLSQLTLSDNALTGPLPVTLLDNVSSSLRVLDVNANELSGTVPDVIESLTSLLVFLGNENAFTGTLPFPGGSEGDLLVAMFNSNLLSQVDEGAWCDVLGSANSRTLRCGLANTDIPCALSCGTGETTSLDELCGVSCACPADFSAYVATLTPADSFALAFSHVAESNSCTSTGDGDVCEYSCAAGYEPGIFVAGTNESVCLAHSASSEVEHLVTCNAGVWENVDVEGVEHGCVEAVCSSLTVADVPHAVESVCANSPSGFECPIECLPGYTRQGSATVTCLKGAWVAADTQCVAVEDPLDLFSCQALSDEDVANVMEDSCKDTPGFYSSATEANTDYTGLLSLATSELHKAVDCAFECSPGYHVPDGASDLVTCHLGQWQVPALAECVPRTCDEFWSPWSSECSSYCPTGTDPGAEYRTFSYRSDEMDDVRAAGCETPNATVEQRNCTSWPRCLSACSEHWSEWSSCSKFCSGGVHTRTFGIPVSGLPPPSDYENFTNITGWDWNDYLRRTCFDRQGDLEQKNCTEWEACQTMGDALSSTVICVALMALVTLLVLRGLREEREIRQTRMGKSFLRVSGGDMQQAIKMLKTMRWLQQRYPDLKAKAIWFAMDRGRRTPKEAEKVLRDAHELMRAHTDMPLVEALEVADWQSPARLRTMGNLGRLLVWQHCAEGEQRETFKQAVQDAKAVGELLQTAGEDEESIAANCRAACNKHPYFHLLCHQPWRDAGDQLWALGQLLQHLPLMYLDHYYLPRPCYLRRTPPSNVLRLALERRIAPKVLAALATSAPAHAEAVPLCLFGDYFAFWETQGLLLEYGLSARHLVTKSSVTGRLLERESSLKLDAAKMAQRLVKNNNRKKQQAWDEQTTKKRRKVGAKGRRKADEEEEEEESEEDRRLRLQKERAEELEVLGKLLEESAQARLAARISKSWWNTEGGGNGSAGFVPPQVKARELQQCLELYAESLLDPEWVPAFDEIAAAADTGALLKQLFRMGGMAEAMNAVTPTILADVSGTNWWVDEDGDADGGDYDDSNQSGAGTGYRRDWYGGTLGPSEKIEQNAQREKEAKLEREGPPELYPVKPRRKLTKEQEEDEMWLATKKGLSLAQVVPLHFKQKGTKVVNTPKPWKEQFLRGFLTPILVILKRFLTLEIAHATEPDETQRLQAVCNVLMRGFQGVYAPVAKEHIDRDYDLPSFLEEMTKINTQLKDEREAALKRAKMSPPGTGPALAAMMQSRALQTKDTVEELYLAAHQVMPRFRLFLEDVATQSRAMGGSGVAPLKSMYRALEKAAFRADGAQWSVDSVLDVVRGSLRFATMGDFTRCLRLIREYDGVQIRRLKDRFSNPTETGWRDCLLNISFVDDPNKFICEVQLVHHQMMKTEESGVLAPNDFRTFRSASELLKIVAELEKQRAQNNGLTNAEARKNRQQRRPAQRTDAVYLKYIEQQKQALTETHVATV